MKEKELKGKVAVITGSGRGIGKEYAMLLAKAGANIVIHDRTSESASRFGETDSIESVVEEIKSLGVDSKFYAADIRNPIEIENFVKEVVKDFGRIDILVNNAGGDIGATTPRPDPNDCLDIKIEDIESVVSRNLLSTMYLCKYVGTQMREQNSGKIINIGSIGAHMTTEQGVIYGASKLAIEHYTRCLAEQMRQYDVNVNCVAPGKVKTARIEATREIANEDGLPRLKRFADPKDLAKIVLFLVSSDSDILTGETIVCWA